MWGRGIGASDHKETDPQGNCPKKASNDGLAFFYVHYDEEEHDDDVRSVDSETIECGSLGALESSTLEHGDSPAVSITTPRGGSKRKTFEVSREDFLRPAMRNKSSQHDSSITMESASWHSLQEADGEINLMRSLKPSLTSPAGHRSRPVTIDDLIDCGDPMVALASQPQSKKRLIPSFLLLNSSFDNLALEEFSQSKRNIFSSSIPKMSYNSSMEDSNSTIPQDVTLTPTADSRGQLTQDDLLRETLKRCSSPKNAAKSNLQSRVFLSSPTPPPLSISPDSLSSEDSRDDDRHDKIKRNENLNDSVATFTNEDITGKTQDEFIRISLRKLKERKASQSFLKLLIAWLSGQSAQ